MASMSGNQLEDTSRERIVANMGLYLSPLLLALAVDSLLMGMAVNQFIHWWTESKNEAARIRFLLYLAFFGAIAGTSFTWATILDQFSTNYGEYSQFVKCNWIAWYGVIDPLTKISVQLFYAERAWRLHHRNHWLLGSIVLCLCCSVTGSVGYTFTTRHLTIDTFDSQAKIFFYLWPGACVTADLIITFSIIYGLWNSRTGIKHTDRIVMRLMRMSLEAQVPPTIVALLFFVQFAAQEMSSIVQFIAVIHPKVYLVGCLAVLNSRSSLREEQKTSYVHAPGAYSAYKGSYGSSDQSYSTNYPPTLPNPIAVDQGQAEQPRLLDGIHIEKEIYVSADPSSRRASSRSLSPSRKDIKDVEMAETGHVGTLSYDGGR
ncbi:hypothetical protein IAU60_005007 [Kwoniella sp. DSM 27419]